MADYYIGLISGTSMDGIDAVLARFGDSSMDLVYTLAYSYPPALRQRLVDARHDGRIHGFGDCRTLHEDVGACFRDAALELLRAAGVDAADVSAIGSHGQTIRHEPNAARPYSLQIGDANVVADGTGIVTIADFRRADIALGGQGAPLMPAFHEWLFRRPEKNRVVLNIGGIANVTLLPAGDEPTTGFDTGPGNTLMDAWIATHRELPYDKRGNWAAGGRVNRPLLKALLADPYFAAAPPKSTGFEHFNLDWLARAGTRGIDPADVQATLCALTAESIADAIRGIADEVLVCGGGIHNWHLERRLADALPGIRLGSTASAGLDPDWVEAAGFAWLAMRTSRGLTGNLPAVTGASRAAVLGETFCPA